MQELHYETILTGLKTILSEGGNGNFVIFDLTGRQSQYIQVAGENGGNNLWVEAGYIDELSDSQKKQLKDRGWETPEEANLINYSRQIPIHDLKECEPVAEMILETFRVVFDFNGNEPFEGKVTLEQLRY